MSTNPIPEWTRRASESTGMNTEQHIVEWTDKEPVVPEYHAPFAQELASAEETLAHRVRKLRSEEAAEVMAVNAYQREAGQAALRAHRAKMRLGAIRDELRSLGSE